MTAAPGFLEFFILEASEYVQQLDGLLLAASSSGPDAPTLQRVARALRGTATMAKLTAYADLAGAVERVGRALQDDAVAWDPGLGGALVSAVDELKALLRDARQWSAADDQRAAARARELSGYAPARPGASGGGTAARTSTAAPGFFVTESANIGAGLELLTTRAAGVETAANVLQRVRALRGVAGVKEIAPLAEALEATEEAARPLETGEPLSAEARQLLESAGAYFREISTALRGGGNGIDPDLPAQQRFRAARDAWASREDDRERVVPIASLFYDDGAAGVVDSAAHPPTSPTERFRLELVSLGEHLRQVLDAARHAAGPDDSAHARRGVRRALRALESAADSFGEASIAALLRTHREAAERVDMLTLAPLEALARDLSASDTNTAQLVERWRALAAAGELSSAIGEGFAPAPHAPAAHPRCPHVPPPRADTPPSPTEPAARTDRADTPTVILLDASITAIERLADTPFAQPVALPEDAVVPIDTLLYRGRAALDRAVEIRDQMRRAGARSDAAALEELFDLLDLARAE